MDGCCLIPAITDDRTGNLKCSHGWLLFLIPAITDDRTGNLKCSRGWLLFDSRDHG